MSDTVPFQPYDLEAVYDEKIFPLMAQIIAICKEHKLPMTATVQYGGRDMQDRDFCTTEITYPERDFPESGMVRRATRGPGLLAFTITSPKDKP